MLIRTMFSMIFRVVFSMEKGTNMHELVDFIYAYLQNMEDGNVVVKGMCHEMHKGPINLFHIYCLVFIYISHLFGHLDLNCISHYESILSF